MTIHSSQQSHPVLLLHFRLSNCRLLFGFGKSITLSRMLLPLWCDYLLAYTIEKLIRQINFGSHMLDTMYFKLYSVWPCCMRQERRSGSAQPIDCIVSFRFTFGFRTCLRVHRGRDIVHFVRSAVILICVFFLLSFLFFSGRLRPSTAHYCTSAAPYLLYIYLLYRAIGMSRKNKRTPVQDYSI